MIIDNAQIDSFKAGEELDHLVAEKVMGWAFERAPISGKGVRSLDSWRDQKEKWVAPANWSPSKDLAAAFEVVQKLRLSLFSTSWNTWIVFREEFAGTMALANGKMKPFQVEGEDLLVVICKSALRYATRGNE